MPSYRFYSVNKTDHVIFPGVDRDFDDDQPALKHAEALADGHAIDVWLGLRLVGHVEAAENRTGWVSP